MHSQRSLVTIRGKLRFPNQSSGVLEDQPSAHMVFLHRFFTYNTFTKSKLIRTLICRRNRSPCQHCMSFEIAPGEENIFGISDGVQKLFDNDLVGALALTVVGSVSWQLVAPCFPIAFVCSPIMYILLLICLLLEGTGIRLV
jgi:Silicon transporter